MSGKTLVEIFAAEEKIRVTTSAMKNIHAQALGKLGGASTSPAKIAAARANWQKAVESLKRKHWRNSGSNPNRSQRMGGSSKGNFTKSVRKQRKAGKR
jgi:hypothetical protein